MSKFYGNSTPVKKSPKQITLTNVPVHAWRYGIEYHFNACGYSSKCGSFTPKIAGESGLAIESPTRELPYIQYFDRSRECQLVNSAAIGATLGILKAAKGNMNDAWCWVPESCLSCVFGEAAGMGVSIPPNNSQFGQVNAKAIQIIPVSKEMDTPDGTMATYKADLNLGNKKPPSLPEPVFRKVVFHLPDPTESTNIDTTIPYILVGYYNAGMLDPSTLNEYLSGYLLTNINGIPRYAYTSSKHISSLISAWKSLPGNTYVTDSTNYCQDSNLGTNFCKTFCGTDGTGKCDTNLQSFCQMGPGGKVYRQNGNGENVPPNGIPISSSPSDLLAMYPNTSNHICDCFMPISFYQAKDFYTISQSDDKGAKDVFDLTVQAGGYNNVECNATCASSPSYVHTSAYYHAKHGANCKPIQICLSQQEINNYGDMTGAKINLKSDVNCTQNTNEERTEENTENKITPASPLPDSTPSPPSSVNLKIILAVVGVLVFLSIILFFFL